MTAPPENRISVEQRGPGLSKAVGLALAAAVLLTLWWPVAGLMTENWGSDCVRYFGESGARYGDCHQVNERAKDWIPLLVLIAWITVPTCFFVPRQHSRPRHIVGALALSALAVGVLMGLHASSVGSP